MIKSRIATAESIHIAFERLNTEIDASVVEIKFYNLVDKTLHKFCFVVTHNKFVEEILDKVNGSKFLRIKSSFPVIYCPCDLDLLMNLLDDKGLIKKLI